MDSRIVGRYCRERRVELRDVGALYLARWRRLVGTVPARAWIAGALLVAALASVNFLVDLDRPAGAIWDESYYVTAAQRYRDRTAQFASHPPLGLMLIAAGDAVMQPHRSAADAMALARDEQIASETIPRGFRFSTMRAASGLFAVIGAVLFFALMRALVVQLVPALLLSNLYVFDNAFIAHFRAAHLDAFQIAFLLAALICFVVSERRGVRSSPWLELGMSVCVGLALMVKVNVAPFVLLPVMLVARRLWLQRDHFPASRKFVIAIRDLSVSAAGVLLACAAVFTLHVAISSHPPDANTPAGAKDARFISPIHREYLNQERPLSPAVLLSAGRDYAKFMAVDYAGMSRIDPNGSHPLEWPLNSKPINYRWDSDGTRTAHVDLIGNPVGWAVGLTAIAAAVVLLIRGTRRPLIVMLLLLYAAYMGLHLYLDGHRVLYLYHYFPALLLSFCLMPLVLDEFARRRPHFRRHQHAVLACMAALSLAMFVFLSPLTFHRPLTADEYELRSHFASNANTVSE